MNNIITTVGLLILSLSLIAQTQNKYQFKNEIPYPLTSILNNPSFENMFSCPTSYGQTHKLQNWISPSDGTPDFLNTCGFSTLPTVTIPNSSLSLGSGYIGLIDSYYQNGDVRNGSKEYIATTFNRSLEADKKYLLKIKAGIGKVNNTLVSSQQKIALSIFGTTSTSPFFSGKECPLGLNGYVELATDSIIDNGTWQELSFIFKPSKNINSISIGPACEDENKLEYIFIDDIEVYRVDTFYIKSINNGCYDYQISLSDFDTSIYSLQIIKNTDTLNNYSKADSIFYVKYYNSDTSYMSFSFNYDTFNVVLNSNLISQKEKCKRLYFPNTFTPTNKDGLNDVFKIYSRAKFEYYSLKIYNRWGSEVIDLSNKKEWDGTNKKHNLCKSGVYQWSLTYKIFDDVRVFTKKGHVTLL